jgi:flagellar biogenesis protein FliO
MLSSITTLFSSLALVIGIFVVGLYLATYLRGKGSPGGWIKVLAASDLGGKRTIAVVEVADEVLVLEASPLNRSPSCQRWKSLKLCDG